MSHIVFENSTIADVLKNAARISPKEGTSAYSFTPGIYMQILDDGSIVVRSTDGQIFYTQWSNSLEYSGGSWEWHFTDRISKWCSGLPIGSGMNVTFSDDNGMLTLRHNKKVHKVSLIEGMEYPHWEPFSEDDATIVPEFYSKIDQVQWAAALGSESVRPEFQGVCLDGDYIIATNSFRAAMLPLDFPPAKGRPITFPHKIITPMIKAIPDVPVIIDNNNIGIIPDEYSQIFIRAFTQSPAVAVRTMQTQYDHYLEFNNEVMANALTTMINSVGQTENPVVKLMMLNESIFISMKGKAGDIAQDVIEVPGFAVHDYASVVSYDPNYLLRAVTNTPRHTGKLHYNKENTKINYISCEPYQAWVSQRWSSDG
ncbi:DNA polymerase III sliding clamp [Gordonia phage Gibbles]|nr:DNA polymerase III sliding clamp [Gordonia phage Gibbles]